MNFGARFFSFMNLKAQLRAPGNKPAWGKALQTLLSPLRQERVGRAGVLVCLVVRSNQRRSDPPPGRRKWEDAVNCYDSLGENDDSSVEKDDSLVEKDDNLVEKRWGYLWSCAFNTKSAHLDGCSCFQPNLLDAVLTNVSFGGQFYFHWWTKWCR